MKSYHGWRDDDGVAHVIILSNGFRSLPVRLDLVNHSPDGFEWGYGGSGPAQLALALLADALEDDKLADLLHQDFKWRHVASIPQDVGAWHMTADEVRAAARAISQNISLETLPNVVLR